ncbi:hypothetical protein [Streptomyces triticirhizae]|uniref:Uncharacterized protein n=1 Tax=Streptomyces triticirhizae TaxID=2483353 RepID=A0A3M2L6T5_9ACTN|nr:hypothetical protein [Streptomyces triticirhizae]RMI31625.1 hypothetical protein EBN88_25550 [Streptomyces triticirhizae]
MPRGLPRLLPRLLPRVAVRPRRRHLPLRRLPLPRRHLWLTVWPELPRLAARLTRLTGLTRWPGRAAVSLASRLLISPGHVAARHST